MPRHMGWLTIAFLGLSMPAWAGTPFVPEVVSSGYNAIGRFNSLALDGQGNPHISYYDGTFGTLQYASRAPSGGWTVETADAGGSDYVGLFSSLKLDPQGNPRIAYYDSTSQDLRYASKTGGAWTIETVETPGDVGQYCSLALDGQGNPHISYYTATSGYLKYASKPSVGPWVIEAADPDPTNYVGTHTSLAIDGSGRPHISYLDITSQQLKYATKTADGAWVHEAVDLIGNSSSPTSLALDLNGAPAIAYLKFDIFSTSTARTYASNAGGSWTAEAMHFDYSGSGNITLGFDSQGNPHALHPFAGALLYFSRSGGVWTTEVVEAPTLTSYVADFASLALDAQGNPKGSYNASGANGLKLVDSSVRVVGPGSGVTWPVGALRTIDWRGIGPVTLSLSTDGGASYQTLLEGVGATPVSIRVPHAPTHFARVKVERGYPLSTAFSESTFTIQTSVALLALLAAPAPGGGKGAVISWQTDPGPGDLAGYRLEKATAPTGPGSSPDWRTLAVLTRETSVADPLGGPGSRYRLFAVNGFGEELWLGEASLRPLAPLAAWPLPYRGGALSISFATTGGLGTGEARTDVGIFDVSGRLVRRIASDPYPQGYQTATWDGRDERGRSVSAGIYFLRSRSGGEERTLKLSVLR
jgi:hypothetical protein